MNKEKKLISNTIIVAIGKISTQFISFFLLPLYTSLLTAHEYGIVELLNTFIILLIPIFFLQLDQASFRFLIDTRDKPEEQKELISTIFFISFVQSIIYLLLFLIASVFIHNQYKYFLATNVLVSFFANLFLQISRGLGDNKTYSFGSLLVGVITITLNVIFIAILKYGAYGMLLATLLANLICIIYILFKKRIYKYIKKKSFNSNKTKSILKFSLPLVPNQISWWIVNASDKVIISKILGLAANGAYSAANKFSSISITIFNVFNLAWVESASLAINEKDKNDFYSKILNIVYGIFSSLCFLIISLMPFCFSFLITSYEYIEAYNQIPILMISTLFNIIVSFLGSIYIALKKSNEIAKTSIYAAILNISINIFLIKYIGLYAASISTLIAYLSMAIYRYFDIRKYVKVKLNSYMLILSVFIGIVILILYFQKNLILLILGLLISIVYTIYINKNIILNLKKIVLKIISK